MSESISDIEVFVASAEGERLAHAARVLGLTPAGASAALKRLEQSLGVKLMLRTTRKLRLTQAGERYLVHARQALAALREGRLALSTDADAIAGLLRITAPADFGRNRLMTRLVEFAARHPGVRFQVTLDDAVSDFFSAPIDLALRYGALGDARLVAVPLAELPRVLCASPGYLARRGEPAHPSELPTHDVLCYMQQQRAVDRWRLSRGAESLEVDVAPRWVFNDAEMVRRCAIRGMGIAYRIRGDVEDDIDAGRLRHVLPEWQGEPVALSLVYPDRTLSPALRRLITFLSTDTGNARS
jgi:DNA-binding transcriptional LysR family regulator